MPDLLFVLLTLVLFAIAAGYIRVLERL